MNADRPIFLFWIAGRDLINTFAFTLPNPMRLSLHQQSTIRETLKRHFGPASRICLFGSRTDDSARGGDIDLYIEPAIQTPDQIVEARLNALAELHLALGEQTIDLVIHRDQGPDLPIHQHARETGVPL